MLIGELVTDLFAGLVTDLIADLATELFADLVTAVDLLQCYWLVQLFCFIFSCLVVY